MWLHITQQKTHLNLCNFIISETFICRAWGFHGLFYEQSQEVQESAVHVVHAGKTVSSGEDKSVDVITRTFGQLQRTGITIGFMFLCLYEPHNGMRIRHHISDSQHSSIIIVIIVPNLRFPQQ